jgi:hypothetical protein
VPAGEVNYISKLEPSRGASLCISTLLAGISEGARDIYLLVYEQITKSELTHKK